MDEEILSSTCSVATSRDTSVLKTYMPSPESICHYGFRNSLPIRPLMSVWTHCHKLIKYWSVSWYNHSDQKTAIRLSPLWTL